MSDARFADGLRYRIEIPSVEGPRVLEAVLEEAERRSVPVRRISQGSGVMMLTDDEIRAMAALGAEAGVEVSLFLGPRGAWDTGGQSIVTSAAGGVARGQAGIDASVAEVRRGVTLGIRSFLVADLGVLKTLGDMRRTGDLPASLVLKTSVLLPCANSATAHTLEELGATTINVSTDLSPAELGELRSACTAPLDVYVEVPDDQGGFVRYLRGSGDRPPRGARLRQARSAQRPEHLSVGTPPRGARGEARPRARAARGARSATARGAGAGARRGPGRRPTARPRDPRAVRERFAAVYGTF